MQTIEILNPAPGGAGYTSLKKANEHMARGRGVIEDGVFRFFDNEHPRHRRIEGFAIAVVDRWSFPHTQWFHGEVLP